MFFKDCCACMSTHPQRGSELKIHAPLASDKVSSTMYYMSLLPNTLLYAICHCMLLYTPTIVLLDAIVVLVFDKIWTVSYLYSRSDILVFCSHHQDFNRPVGMFSQSLFIPGSSRALTGTSEGCGLIWEQVRPPAEGMCTQVYCRALSRCRKKLPLPSPLRGTPA